MNALPRILLGIVLAVPVVSFASEKLLVRVPAVLDPAAPITSAVKNECGIELLIGNHTFKSVSARFPEAVLVQDAQKVGEDKLLQLTILSVQGIGGGAWTGAKSITVRADLFEGKRQTQSTVLQRHSRGGAFGGMSGTCPIMERIAVALGTDVAKWLATTAMSGSPVAKDSSFPASENEGPKPDSSASESPGSH